MSLLCYSASPVQTCPQPWLPKPLLSGRPLTKEPQQKTPAIHTLQVGIIRPDKLIPAARRFVADVLGASFVEPPAFDLAGCFKESSPATPLVFVLSPGMLAHALPCSPNPAASSHAGRT